MKMVALEGVQLDISSLLEAMRKLADYIYFDGPLLSLFRGAHGNNYFRYWCDTEDSRNRWMLFEISEENRLAYLEGSISLRQLVNNEENLFVYFVETGLNSEILDTRLVPLGNIPDEYIPDADSFYEFEPVNVSPEAESSYTVLIDERWSLADLGTFRGLYERPYSFVYALKELLPSGKNIAGIRDVFSRLPWRGGFSSMHFFNEVQGLVPKGDRPEVAVMQYASPGWIELQLSRDVAMELRSLVYYAQENRARINEEISRIHDELRVRRLLGANGLAVQDWLSPDDNAYISKLLFSFSELIRFPYTKEILQVAPNALAALKILISFTRRMWRLVDFGLGHKVKL